MNELCPHCNIALSEKRAGFWTEWICMECGSYKSDSPAYKAYPELFANMIRANPEFLLEEIITPRMNALMVPEVNAARTPHPTVLSTKKKLTYPTRTQQHRREYTSRLKITTLNHYAGHLVRCECCHESNPVFLTLDHVNNDGHAHRKTVFGKANVRETRGSSFYRWLRDHDYPQIRPLQILCYNCQIGKIGGPCPHTRTCS